MSARRFAKWCQSVIHNRRLTLPAGARIRGSQVAFDSCQLAEDVAIVNSTLGEGGVVGASTRISDSHCEAKVRLGERCNVHGSHLGRHSSLQDACNLVDCRLGMASYMAFRGNAVGATIGPFTSIGPDCLIGPAEHPVDWFSSSPHFYGDFFRESPFNDPELTFPETGTVEIGADVWIGARVIIRSGLKIGHGAIIAAGAVVTKDVPPYTIVGGVPAKPIRPRFDDATVARLLALAWWNWPEERLRGIAKLLATNDLAGLEALAQPQ